MSLWQRLCRRTALNAQLAWQLGPGITGKIRLLTAAFFVHLLARLGTTRRNGIRVRVRIFDRTFDCQLHDYSDLSVLREVFLAREYDLDLAEPPEVILDLGSNVGLSLIYFRLKYPDARIFGFEADPLNLQRALKNIASFDGITCRHVAVSDENGTTKLYVDSASAMSSALSPRQHDQPFIEVPAKTLDALMTELSLSQIDLLKFDVEGHEFAIFRAFRGLARVRALVGELHLDLIEGTKEEFLSLLAGFDVAVHDSAPERRCIVKAVSTANRAART